MYRLAGTAGVLVALAAPAGAACDIGQTVSPDGQQVLTLSEAASFLRIDDGMLDDAANRGEVPARHFGDEWRFARAALIAWLAGSEAPADCIEPVQRAAARTTRILPAGAGPVPVSAARLEPWEMAAVAGRGPAAPPPTAPVPPSVASGPVPGTVTERPPAVAGKPGSYGEAPERDTAREVALRREIVLTPKGAFGFELDLFYAREDQDLSGLSPFGVTVSSRRSEQFGAALTGRYGIRDDLEVAVSVPWLTESEKLALSYAGPPVTISDTSSRRLDDARFTLQYGALAEGLRRPGMVLSGEGRVPMDGSDAYSLGAGISLVKSIDPVALFGSFGYLHTFNGDTRDSSEIVPENSYAAVAGFALAMNDRLSLSTSVNGTFTPRSEVGDAFFDSETIFNLRLALTALVTDSFYVEPAVSMRLNGPSNAFSFGVSFPYVSGN